MARSLPGTEKVEGREFIYLEVSKGRNFSGLMQDVLTSCPATPMPQSGGILEEKARLVLPDKTSLLAVSFKGDLLGWRNKILGYCGEKGLKWAAVREQFLTLSDGAEIPLADCQVEFEA
jgi:hypothetical protein